MKEETEINACCPACVRTDQERRLFCGKPDCVCHNPKEEDQIYQDYEVLKKMARTEVKSEIINEILSWFEPECDETSYGWIKLKLKELKKSK